ncbi:hypothetical protein KIN20_023612 [Parelaphostrongylus tenuis]|uniref:Uncharacterized protein n=1 Tax=Parelaphostrongylus tenuis TaxID=148309 RepID=A0AAD5MVV7_PARTN|nr:hypothetical protein KIN20_023612 [Parelaphostrongylus tenuis]
MNDKCAREKQIEFMLVLPLPMKTSHPSNLVSNGMYIGEKGRPPHVRIQEHSVDKCNFKPNIPLGTHKIQTHEEDDFDVKVNILTQEHKTSARKVLEAFSIHSKN